MGTKRFTSNKKQCQECGGSGLSRVIHNAGCSHYIGPGGNGHAPSIRKGTFWNGEPCFARCVTVIVGKSEQPTWWCAELEGQQRKAVEIRYYDQGFFLDNEDGQGWLKVTLGQGSPQYGHKSLPDSSMVVDEAR